jgi:hypothetical protein
MEHQLTDEELNYTPNEKLLDDASAIKEEEKLVCERLKKLDDNKNGVSPTVYQRVRSDYLTRLDGCNKRFTSLRTDLDQELVRLTEKKLTIQGSLKLHVEHVEEAKLRHALGEFSKEAFEKSAKRETEEIKRMEGALAKISKRLERYEGLVGAEPVAEPKPAPKVEVKVPASITEKKEFPTPKQAPIEITTKVSLEARKAEEKKFTAILCIMENGKIAQKVEIDHNLSIGRSPANDVILKEAKVSRKHAEVVIDGNIFLLRDLDSSNGTFVGGNRITEHPLSPNDEIRIGKATLVFKLEPVRN